MPMYDCEGNVPYELINGAKVYIADTGIKSQETQTKRKGNLWQTIKRILKKIWLRR